MLRTSSTYLDAVSKGVDECRPITLNVVLIVWKFLCCHLAEEGLNSFYAAVELNPEVPGDGSPANLVGLGSSVRFP